MIILIFILFILHTLYKNNRSVGGRPFVKRNQELSWLSNFHPNNLLKKMGEKQVPVSQYKDKDPYNAAKILSIKLNEFLNNDYIKYFPDHKKNDRYQIKLQIFKPYPGFLRISSSNWKFPFHFDCTENVIIQLYGKRKFILKKSNKKTEYMLNPGDILYIPMSYYHSVKEYSGSNLSIMCSFDVTKEGKSQKVKQCTRKFDKLWPIQSKKCTTNNCL